MTGYVARCKCCGDKLPPIPLCLSYAKVQYRVNEWLCDRCYTWADRLGAWRGWGW